MRIMEKASQPNQFKLGLNKMVGDICYAHESQVMSLRSSLDSALEFNAFFTPYEWREIAHASQRLLQASTVPEKEYALALLSNFNKLPSGLEQALAQCLINSSPYPNAHIAAKPS